MYITKDFLELQDGFNWPQYFNENRQREFSAQINIEEIYQKVRLFLKEDNFKMGGVLYKVLKEVFAGEQIVSLSVLELGAGSGFLTRSVLSLYKGSGVLVDKNEESYHQFDKLNDKEKTNIKYIIRDLFQLDIKDRFDIVCSFGLIEHFSDKKEVINCHIKFMKPDGKLLIIVPLDTPLTRAYFEINPELNLGYRELLNKNEFIKVLDERKLKIKKLASSYGYSYDFIAALCVL